MYSSWHASQKYFLISVYNQQSCSFNLLCTEKLLVYGFASNMPAKENDLAKVTKYVFTISFFRSCPVSLKSTELLYRTCNTKRGVFAWKSSIKNQRRIQLFARHNVHAYNEPVQYESCTKEQKSISQLKSRISRRKRGKLFGELPDWLTN